RGSSPPAPARRGWAARGCVAMPSTSWGQAPRARMRPQPPPGGATPPSTAGDGRSPGTAGSSCGVAAPVALQELRDAPDRLAQVVLVRQEDDAEMVGAGP